MRWGSMWTLAAGLFFASLPGIAAAQINPTLSEAERGIRDEGSEDPAKHLRIETLAITAHVTGRTADVTLELLIGSDDDDDYEAKLGLDLPADAVVTGYALNVGEALIPGLLLDKPRARNIYEDEIREGIDPGLAEVSAGNRFTTRIYPIDKTSPRRFRLSFVAPFDPAKGVVLPLARDAAIGTVTLDVRVDGYAVAPLVQFAGKAIELTRDGTGWRSSTRLEKPVLREGLAISGGTLAGPLMVTQHASGERFFVISDAAPPPAGTRPGRLRIYWDRSLSHGRARTDLETEVLVRLADARGATAIDLVTFASDRPRVVTVKDTAGLRAALAATVYRGGTSFEGLDGLSLPAASQCILVSDGQATIDRNAEFAPDCPLSVLTASTEADGARLGQIAQQSGGILVRATEGKAGEAATALAQPGSGPAIVRDGRGRRLAFRALPTGAGNWTIVGPMPDRGSVRVRMSDGSERTYAAAGAVVRADPAGALWAVPQVQALGDDPARHQAMVDLARRYQVAGPAMSFLVLETPDQYLRAKLAPPPGFPAEWMEQYRGNKAQADEDEATERSDRFDYVLEEWQERQEWWKERFDRDSDQVPDRAHAVAMPPPAPSPVPEILPPPAEVVSSASPALAAPQVSGRMAGMVAAGGGGSGEDAIIVTSAQMARVETVSSRPPGDRTIGLDLADLISKRPYIVALDAAAPAKRLTVLAEQERAYGSVPSFYLDVAEWFRLKGDAATADLLLLSALELPLSDDETAQIVAFRLERDKSYDRAVELTERLAAANAEFRPQPARELALALAARGRSRGAAGRADLERAFTLLTDAALNPASDDFDGFEVVALMEANALIPDIEAVGGRWTLDRRLVGLLDTDVRIVIAWTADDADIDLWVTEPNGERVYYGNDQSSAGGQISNDMTDGYGPEEYAIRRAPRGSYLVQIEGFDADRINPNGPGHVLIRLIRNFGRRSEQEVMVDVDVAFEQGQEVDENRPVATLKVGR